MWDWGCQSISAGPCRRRGRQHQIHRTSFQAGSGCLRGDQSAGGPVGSADFCAELTAKRVAKAEELLSNIDKYGHTQGPLLLLRHCASYTSRTVPPELHKEDFARFNMELRRGCEQLLGDNLPERSWALAQVGSTHCGLGVRGPARHASAAYLGRLHQSRDFVGARTPASMPRIGVAVSFPRKRNAT
jgi:hypothetical protein